MKEKTKIFKMIATLVCIMMLLTMFSTYSFADIGSSDKATITINKLEPGIDLTAYQLTTVNYDFDNNQLIEPPYSWVAPIKTWLQSHDTYSIYENDLKKFEEDMNASTDTKKAFYSAHMSFTARTQHEEAPIGGIYPVYSLLFKAGIFRAIFTSRLILFRHHRTRVPQEKRIYRLYTIYCVFIRTN